ACCFVHAPAEPGHWLVDARRVEQCDLRRPAVEHTEDGVSGRLRSRRHDRQRLIERYIEECRLADIRPPDEYDWPASRRFLQQRLGSHAGRILRRGAAVDPLTTESLGKRGLAAAPRPR